MQYISTRGQAPALGFEDTMLAGLARDGGLYVPETWPTFTPDDIRAMRGQPYEEVAFRVMRPFQDAFDDATFRAQIDRAYAGFGHRARCPLVQMGPDDWLLELFHGPTLAFKDVAMQLIGQMFAAALDRRDGRLTIVGATSGDTGSAAIEAFRGLARVDVFILFPHGRISEVQRRQMTTPTEPNVRAIAIEGDFDACQARVKDMFNDHVFRDRVSLGAINSINWARVLAQAVYYVTAAVSLGAPDRAVSFTVPTGNFGDIFAGYVAAQMGLPIQRLVIATNQNDILHRTLVTGDHRREAVVPTTSPSMDIQVSSNFERLLFDLMDREGPAVAQLMAELKDAGGFRLSQGALERLRTRFGSGRATDAEVAETIRKTLAETGELLCPHSAAGVHVAAQHPGPMVTLATAHPAKFPAAVEAATGVTPPLPSRMADLYERPERVTVLPDDLAVLQRHILEETGL